MPQVQEYHISVPESDIRTLKHKLNNAIFPDELDGAEWDYGSPLTDIKRLITYWAREYDWRQAEALLNELPNYETTIIVDGFGPLQLHFIHQKSENKAAIPLLFIHGWPGSFLEVTKLLPLLKNSEREGGPAFNVIAPSLPNFGFSTGVKDRGFGLSQYAEACHRLMLTLGYDQYVTQGGDWGSFISRVLSQLYPDHVKATHLNLIPAAPPRIKYPIAFIKSRFVHWLNLYKRTEKEGMARTKAFMGIGTGYQQVQKTKPQTLGYALADSPVALLAWIYEKLHDWTDAYPWTQEEICTWVSIYWFSRAGPAASVRIYYESQRGKNGANYGIYVPKVKLGFAYFPGELIRLPKAWGRLLGPVVYEKDHDSGGHFAAWEAPESLVTDLMIMFGKGGGAYGVVEDKNGFN